MTEEFRPNLAFTGYLDIFDAVEMHPCCEINGDVQQCKEAEATFWSVYLHYNPNHEANDGFGGIECIADFKTKEQAEILAEALDNILIRILPAGVHIPMR